MSPKATFTHLLNPSRDGDSHYCPGQPVTGLNNPFREEFFANIQPKPWKASSWAWRAAGGWTGSQPQGLGKAGKKDIGEAFRWALCGKQNPDLNEVKLLFSLPRTKGLSPQHCPYQGVALHVLPAGEFLPTDLAGIGPLSRVGSHVSLQDALVHGWKAAVWALELLPDDCELVDCKERKQNTQINLRTSQNSLLVDYFTIKLVHCEITLSPLNQLHVFNPFTVLLPIYY